jgi:hypothetical protein
MILKRVPFTFFADGAMTGDRSLLDSGKPPDGGNAAVNGRTSNEPLDAKLAACCRNKRHS